jgi:intracellular multiplication protein IcmO
MKKPDVRSWLASAVPYGTWLRNSALPTLYQSRLGGSTDAMSLSLLGGGLAGTSPLLTLSGAAGMAPLLPAAMGMVGAGMLTNRLINEIRGPGFLPSTLGIKSSPPPVNPPGSKFPGMLVGYTTDTGAAVRIPLELLMRHFLTGGMTGVGKTVSAQTFMAQQIAMGGGMLWLDGKLDPDNILMLYHLAKWLGREADFRVINPGDPAQSNSYNMLLYGEPDEVASRILSSIPSTEGNAGADYYKQAANQGLTILIGAIQAAGLAYNAMDLSILLTNDKAMLDLASQVRERAGTHPAVAGFELFLEQYKTRNANTGAVTLDMKKVKDTFGGVAGRLFVYGSGKMGEITGSYNPDVRLFEDIRDGRIIYVALPTMTKQIAAQNFGKITMGDIRSAIGKIQALPKHERPWPPFLWWSDELPSYGSAAAMETPFQQARSAHIYMGVGYQENASIEVLGESFLGSIVGNTYNKIFFKPGSRETADSWADLIGQHKALSETFTRSYGGGGSRATLRTSLESQQSSSESVSVAYREQDEYILAAEKLMELDFGQAVLLHGGKDIYDLRVPKLDFLPGLRAELGDLSVQRPSRTALKGAVEGLNYFDKYHEFLTELSGSPDVKRARAAESKNTEASRPQWGKG